MQEQRSTMFGFSVQTFDGSRGRCLNTMPQIDLYIHVLLLAGLSFFISEESLFVFHLYFVYGGGGVGPVGYVGGGGYCCGTGWLYPSPGVPYVVVATATGTIFWRYCKNNVKLQLNKIVKRTFI